MRWFRDGKSVSLVIGVILMLIITLILASMIAGLSFGMGNKLRKPSYFQIRLKDYPTKITYKPPPTWAQAIFIITDYGGYPIKGSEFKVEILNGTVKYDLYWNNDKWLWYSGIQFLAVAGQDLFDGTLDAGDVVVVGQNPDAPVFTQPDTITLRFIDLKTGDVMYEGNVFVE